MSGEDAKRILDFWEVMDRVDPLPDHWLQTARICEQLDRLSLMYAASCGAGKVGDPAELSDFMPPQWIEPPKAPAQVQDRDVQIKMLDQGNPLRAK